MPNLKQATKKAIYQSKVNQLDALGTDINEFVQQEALSIVEDIAGDFIKRVHDNINNERDFVVTGKINDITIKAENNSINIYATKHLIYQDRGVNGAESQLYNTPHRYSDKKPPIQPIIDWIKRKNLNLKNNAMYHGDESRFKELTEDQQINQAAWAISTKIYQEGLKPRNIYSKEIPQLIADLQQQLGNFVVQAINQAINIKPSAKRVILPNE